MIRILILALAFLTACGPSEKPATLYGGAVAPVGRSGATWSQGLGTPEGTVSAPVGSIYSRRDGGTGTAFYVKATGTAKTGWLSSVQLEGFGVAVGTPAVNHGSLVTGSKNGLGGITSIGAFTSVTLTYSVAYATDSLCMATPLAVGTQEMIGLTTHTGTSVTFSCINSSTAAAANCVDFTYLCFGR